MKKLKYKIALLSRVWSARTDIKRILRRYYLRSFKRYFLNFQDVQAEFSTEDFYSNCWFYELDQIDFAYEPVITRLIIDKLKNAKAFADIGANIGYFSVIAAKVRPDIPIYAIEMDQTLLPVIKRNLELNNLTNVVVSNYAVGNSQEVFYYQPHPFSFFEIIYRENIDIYSLKLPVEVIKLDDYFEKLVPPNLIKIDIDGAEMNALRGMENLLKQEDLELLLELHYHFLPNYSSSIKEVELFLTERGFRFAKITNFRESANCKLEEIYNFDDLQSVTGDMIFVSRKL